MIWNSREHKQNRGPHPAQNEVENGLVEEIAVAEIAVRDLADVDQQLLGDALVELEAVPQLEHELLVHSAHLPGDGLHDVAGGEPDEREVEHDDREQEERGVQDASADQGERLHGVTSGCGGPRRGGIRRGWEWGRELLEGHGIHRRQRAPDAGDDVLEPLVVDGVVGDDVQVGDGRLVGHDLLEFLIERGALRLVHFLSGLFEQGVDPAVAVAAHVAVGHTLADVARHVGAVRADDRIAPAEGDGEGHVVRAVADALGPARPVG